MISQRLGTIKEIAIGYSNELDRQNKKIGGLNDKTENTNARVEKQTKKIKKL